ncbi:hypothetical protein EV44_g3524 [Erysiphe necator]|uniref:Uncharacterized protein n=1 Tax=Uncinula necator TaxID=52586 RepID=A0A0B1P8W9_UNCNE|nr:hypothetical protein EV44_g3524 [Erysiphe necator]
MPSIRYVKHDPVIAVPRKFPPALVEVDPAKSKSSPSRGAGVNAQYALHVWDSQEDSHNPFLQDPHSSSRVSIVFVSISLSPLRLFFTKPPHDWPREYRVKGSILSQRASDEIKLLAQMVGCWLDVLEVVC